MKTRVLVVIIAVVLAVCVIYALSHKDKPVVKVEMPVAVESVAVPAENVE